MTSQGLEEYVGEIEKFIENLEKINTGVEFSQYIREIDIAGDMFIRNSRKKHEKATILIGKELAQTEEVIKIFNKEIGRIIRRNSKIVSRMKSMDKLVELRDLIHKTKKIQDEKNSFIRNLEKEKKEIIEKKDEHEKDLDLFMGGEECKCWLMGKENLEKERERLDEDIRKLEEKIDFKLLLNKFHSIPRNLELLKDYRSDFLDALMSDNGFKILDMIEEDKKKSIEKELREIFERNQYLKSEGDSYKVNKKEEMLKSDIKKAEYHVEIIDKKIEEENKKLEKFLEKEKELRGEEIKMMENILGDVRIVDE